MGDRDLLITAPDDNNHIRQQPLTGLSPANMDDEIMITTSQMTRTLRQVAAGLFLLLGAFILLLITGAAAGNLAAESPPAPAFPKDVYQLLQNALDSERSNLAEIEQSLKRWEAERSRISIEIETYRIQNVAHGNLLVVLQTRVEDLRNALNTNQLAIKSLSERIAQFINFGEGVADRMAQLRERIAVAQKQMLDPQLERLPDEDQWTLQRQYQNLVALMQEKEQRGEAFLEAFEALLQRMTDLREDLVQTRWRLEKRLRADVNAKLFEHTPQPLVGLKSQSLSAELVLIGDRLAGLFYADFWRGQWHNFKRSFGLTQIIFVLIFGMTLVLQRTIRRYLRSVEERLDSPSQQYRRLALMLLRRSFVLVCAAAILWLYEALKLPHMDYSLARFLDNIVLALLAIRWGIDFLQNAPDRNARSLYQFVQKRIVQSLQWLRLLAIGYLTLAWGAGSGSELVGLARLALEMVLLLRVVVFWRELRRLVAEQLRRGEAAPSRNRLVLAWSWSYLVAGGAVLMELTGYRVFAGHWLLTWWEILLLVLWVHIGWRVIHEWDAAQKAVAHVKNEGDTSQVAVTAGWLPVLLTRLLLLAGLVAGAVVAWSSTEFLAAVLKEVFNFAFTMGSLSLSVKGLLFAVVILCATSVATRVGRRFLLEKMLASRDLERGLKDSIVTITSYVLWGLGLVLALGIIGINATSLAVVFGALSIGIGIGMQNIFNNFISGLILLFERPIQVGDYVEVGGLWAEVKKINVRSTIVQTLDNASVIIPNSDLISEQVTNWSFKDPRMRRHVDVGVAYGSDTDLVRDTLLDIAAHTPQVLHYPRPDVLFLDHGDSALIFRLRYWAHVENFYSTSTAIRFELDRRFRELEIEIAFPQRDIHIRTIDPSFFAQAPTANTPPSPSAVEAVPIG